MANALPLRIFLASPGDLENERAAVRACVDEHNTRLAGADDLVYEVVGWERVRGTARRPQEAINELISESHFLIVLFKGSWGSEPGSPWGYTSGTEEELFTGPLELGRAEQPMRDVWVGFLEHSMPDDKIVALRNQMSRRHSMMYESVADTAELKLKLTERLATWGALAESKFHRHISLLPSTGKDVLRAASLRIHGEKLIELGQPVAGRAALKEAAVLGGPLEQLAYARFLGREGLLEEAHDVTQLAIDFFVADVTLLHTPLAAQAFAAQAGLLRRRGSYVDAIGRLNQALTLLPDGEAYAKRVRCRMLDDLDLAHRDADDLPSARAAFEEALEMRRASAEPHEVCQSLVNLARLEVDGGDLEKATAYADEVVDTLHGTPPSALHANAEVLVAQVRLRQGRPEDGLAYAERALSVNQQISNRRGEAIALLLLAQCSRAAGQIEPAEAYARSCLDLNQTMGNTHGMARAQWLLDQLLS